MLFGQRKNNFYFQENDLMDSPLVKFIGIQVKWRFTGKELSMIEVSAFQMLHT